MECNRFPSPFDLIVLPVPITIGQPVIHENLGYGVTFFGKSHGNKCLTLAKNRIWKLRVNYHFNVIQNSIIRNEISKLDA